MIAVLTDADWQRLGWKDLPRGKNASKRRDGTPMVPPPYPPMARGTVRWVGDPVAFVVAETLAEAMDAAELIAVDYEPLPAVTDTVAALADGAPVLWPEQAPGNVCYLWQGGNKAATDAAFAKADRVIKHKAVVNRVTAAAMEPRAALAHWDVAADRMTVYTTLQRAFAYREQMAAMTGLPESKIRLIAPDIGGSFGMKSALYNEVALTILGDEGNGPAREVDGDALGVLPRRRAGARPHLRHGARRRQSRQVPGAALEEHRQRRRLSAGRRRDRRRSATSARWPASTRSKASTSRSTTVYSNTNPMRPYRGNGRGEAAFAIERIVDVAADELRIDPAELRRINMIPPEAMPYKTGFVFTYDCGDFANAMDECIEMADYKGFEARRTAAKARGKLRGIGLSFSIERAAAPASRARRSASTAPAP